MPYMKIVRVISNRSKAYGLTHAENTSILAAYHKLIGGGDHASVEKDPTVIDAAQEKYDADLVEKAMADELDLVVCTGWRCTL